jgi:peptide/nickel transport system substrate-binding protein
MLRFVRRPLAPLFLVLVVGAGLLIGCSRAPDHEAAAPEMAVPPGTPPVVGDWVVQRIDSDLYNLNPLTGDDANGANIRGSWVNESMVQMDNYTLQFKPCLATSWEISPDKLTYTFHLRHGVKWHDGQPFTAEDVKYTYDKVQDPTTDCPFLRVYFNNIKSCQVLDPYTVRFVASEQYFKTLEELGGMTIVAKHVFDQYPNFNDNPASRSPVGTGPYKFVRWDTGSQVVLERNPDYWGGTIAYPQRIVYRIIEEPYVAGQLLKKGEIDVFYKVSPIQWLHELEHSPSMSHLHEMVYSYPAYSYIGFNLREPIFQDVRVRHALDLLIPRDRILSEIYLNQYASKTSGYDLPASPSYNHDVPPTPYDPAQALQLLNAAGWKNDHGDGLLYKDGQPLGFTLLYPSGSPEREKIAELVQESMRQAGVDLKLDRLQFAQMLEHLDDWKFDSCILGWSLDINGDPYQIWHSSQADQKKSSNFIGYKNPAADKLIEQGRLEYDGAKRAAIYRQLHRIIHDDYPCCFLFNPKEILIVSDRYQNVRTFAPSPCFDISTWWVPKEFQKYQ